MSKHMSPPVVASVCIGGVIGLVTMLRFFHSRKYYLSVEEDLSKVSQDVADRISRISEDAEKELRQSMTSRGTRHRTAISQSAKRGREKIDEAAHAAMSRLEQIEKLADNDYAGT